MTTKTATIRGLPVLLDSGVLTEGEGYERILIIVGWNPDNPKQMAQVRIRVDRRPHKSFAHVDVWTPYSGWNGVVHKHPDDFWFDMPGYERSQSEATASKLNRLACVLIDELRSIAQHI